MRILLVILHNDPTRGGAERYTFDLAAALATRGHDLTLAATTHAASPPGAKTVTLRTDAATRLGRYQQMSRALDQLIARDHFNIVHAMLPVANCDLYHPHAGLAVDAPRSWHTRFTNPRRAAFARIERSLLSRQPPPAVLCLSQIVRDAVRRRYPQLLDDATPILFNAVDLDRFDPQVAEPRWSSPRIPAVSPILLMVANDFERKGVAAAIAAIARLHDKTVHLVIAGNDRPKRYQRLAARLAVADRVHFLGAVPDVRPLYRAAHALLLPTRQDPCSLVVLEALAMGLPVISTAANGACELMQDGREGFVLADPRDDAALAARIESLLDPTRRAQMSRAAAALRPQLSFAAHVDRLLEIYKSRQPKLHPHSGPAPAAKQ